METQTTVFGGTITPDTVIRQFILPDFEADGTLPPAPEAKPYVFVSFDQSQSEPEKEEESAPPVEEGPDPVEILAAAEQEAEAILASARVEAERIRQEAADLKREAEEIKARAAEEGRQAGHQQGLAQGRDEGQKTFEAAVTPTIAGLEKIENLYQELWTVNEAPLVKLAVRVAERVVLHELSTPEETITAAFRAAIEHLHAQHRALFRVHPADLEHLESVRGAARDQIKGLLKISFEPDPSLARGDLVMETNAGRLDATVRGRIEALTETIDDTLAQSFDLDW